MSAGPETVGEIGEFALIDRLRSICGATGGADLVLGIGDDTAVLAEDASRRRRRAVHRSGVRLR